MIETAEPVKWCRQCQENKPLSAFRGKREGRVTLNCDSCRRVLVKSAQKSYSKHPEEVRERNRKRMHALRRQIIDAYGAQCACCGESDVRFLAIDHVNGGGNKERRGAAGYKKASNQSLYFSIIRRGFPSEYQVLCHNCNVAKSDKACCPHQLDEKTIWDRMIGGC